MDWLIWGCVFISAFKHHLWMPESLTQTGGWGVASWHITHKLSPCVKHKHFWESSRLACRPCPEQNISQGRTNGSSNSQKARVSSERHHGKSVTEKHNAKCWQWNSSSKPLEGALFCLFVSVVRHCVEEGYFRHLNHNTNMSYSQGESERDRQRKRESSSRVSRGAGQTGLMLPPLRILQQAWVIFGAVSKWAAL